MSERKHTPGPWLLEPPSEEWTVDCDRSVVASSVQAVCSKRRPDPVCFVVQTDRYMIGDGDPEMDANARLIASSPDLLASLFEILNYDGGAVHALADPYVMERAEAAIARATQDPETTAHVAEREGL